MRVMRRVVSFMLALVLAFSLCPVPVLAEGENSDPVYQRVFIVQPEEVVQISQTDLTYTVNWSLNFMPTKVEIWNEHTSDPTDTLDWLGSEGHYTFPADADASTTYHIRAYYYDEAEEKNLYVRSNDFTLSASNLVFALNPQNAERDPYTLTYTVNWTLNFVPVKVEITQSKWSGDPLRTLTENLDVSGTCTFYERMPEDKSYLVRAYYGERKYIESSEFWFYRPASAFTEQPAEVIAINEDNEYVISWRTNFKPQSIFLSYDGGRIHTSELGEADSLGTCMTWRLPGSMPTDREYRIEAYDEDMKQVNSSVFTLDSSSLSFTRQPEETIYIRPEDLQYVVTWETSFDPVKIEIYGGGAPDNWGNYPLAATVTENLRRDMVHVFFADKKGAFFIRAYYTETASVDSEMFRLSRDNLAFTGQPEYTEIDPETLTGTVNWGLNFRPLKIEVFQKLVSYQESLVATLDGDARSYEVNTSFAGKEFYLRAYYSENSSGYIASESFWVSARSLTFTEQPVLFENPAPNSYTIRWATNFVPERIVIRCNDEEFTYLGRDSIIAELEENLSKEGSYSFTFEGGTEYPFYVEASYAGYSLSSDYSVPAGFTQDPEPGAASDEAPHEISWSLNFTPKRLELWALLDGRETRVGALNETADRLFIYKDTAAAYRGGEFFLRAWYGEEEHDCTDSGHFTVFPRLTCEGISLDAAYDSHLFTAEEFDEEWGNAYIAYGSNATAEGAFSYRVVFPAGSTGEIVLTLLDDNYNECLSLRISGWNLESAGLPERFFRVYKDENMVWVDTRIEELRQIFREYAEEHRLANPDLFTISLQTYAQDADGWHSTSFSIRDSHLPIEAFEPEIDYSDFTLTTPIVERVVFPEGQPPVTEVRNDVFGVFATAVWEELPGLFPEPPQGEDSWEAYLYQTEEYDEDLDAYLPIPLEERFARYFGEGYNAWTFGPSNPAPRGPADYVYGIAANKVTRTAPSVEGASVSLSDFMNGDNETYFNSLPGLSTSCWYGYFASEDDMPGNWDELSAEREYYIRGSIENVLTVTFADGVTYRRSGSLIRNFEESSTFVSGESYRLPLLVTIDADEGCVLTVLADYTEENGGTPVKNGDRLAEGTVLTVFAGAKPGYRLTEVPAETYELTENLTITARSEKQTYALVLKHEHGAAPAADAEDIGAVEHGREVTLTAGEPDAGYEYIGWYQPNGKLLTAERSLTVSVTANAVYEARYQAKAGVVTFMANDSVQGTFTGSTIAESDFPAEPSSMYGFEFSGWDKTAAEINEELAQGKNVTVTALFKVKPAEYTITIFNGEAETPEIVTLTENIWVTRTAEDVAGKNFAYWTMDGEIFSYNRKTSFRVYGNCTVTAVYTKWVTPAQGTALVKTAAYNAETAKLSFVSYLTVPYGAVIKAAGIYAAAEGSSKYTDPGVPLTAETADYVKSSAKAVGTGGPVTYTWNKSQVRPGDVWYVLPYVTYTYEGEEQTVCGTQVRVAAGCDYDSSEKGSAVIKSASYNPDTKKATFIAYLSVPEKGVIVKAGLVAASGSNFDPENKVLTADNADYVKSSALAVGKSAPVTYTWNKSKVNAGDVWYARAYLVYTLNGTERTVYGEPVSLTAA